jgi:hypothetical protein
MIHSDTAPPRPCAGPRLDHYLRQSIYPLQADKVQVTITPLATGPGSRIPFSADFVLGIIHKAKP